MHRWISCFLVSLLAMFSLTAEQKPAVPKNETQSLPAGKTIHGDYFIVGDSVEISGIITGDAYITASQVFIDGQVLGDVLVFAGSIDISGQVGNNVRAIGGQINVSGSVGHNMTAIVGNVQMTSSSSVLGNFVCVSGNADLSGTIGGSATVGASNLRLSGTIGDFLNVYCGQMRITSKANINGDVDYRSTNFASIDPSATIRGAVVHHPSIFHNIMQGRLVHNLLVGSKIAGILMNFVYSFVAGLIFLKLFPKKLHSALDSLQTRPTKCLTYGFMLVILFPLASLILLISILGIPFALALIALNIISFYTAKVFTIFWGANFLFSKLGLKKNRMSTYTLGLIIYFALTMIPYFGMAFAFAVMLFGLGAPLVRQRNSFFSSF